VLAAVQELGYRPNMLAQSLTTSLAPIIPLLGPDVSNWFFAEIARGAEEAAWSAGYSLILCNTGRSANREGVYLETLAALQVPAVIVAPNSESSALAIQRFIAVMPVVTIDRLVAGLDLPRGTVDNYLGGRLAAQHLVEFGHRQIACIAGPADASTAQERVQGYVDVLKEAGLVPAVISGGFTTKDGVRAARAFLKRAPRPSAVVCANDLCAVAFIHELETNGVHVPEDVSVIGYDDLPLAALVRPTLTSIYQPARRLGALGVELALGRTKLRSPVRLRPHLVARDSTARAT
jgi:LacI family transcriptional regulator